MRFFSLFLSFCAAFLLSSNLSAQSFSSQTNRSQSFNELLQYGDFKIKLRHSGCSFEDIISDAEGLYVGLCHPGELENFNCDNCEVVVEQEGCDRGVGLECTCSATCNTDGTHG